MSLSPAKLSGWDSIHLGLVGEILQIDQILGSRRLVQSLNLNKFVQIHPFTTHQGGQERWGLWEWNGGEASVVKWYLKCLGFEVKINSQTFKDLEVSKKQVGNSMNIILWYE